VAASGSGVLRLALGRMRSRALAQDDNGYKERGFRDEDSGMMGTRNGYDSLRSSFHIVSSRIAG
jgi:hypothetical protein